MVAIDLINLEDKVFNQWGLKIIEPFPRTALNFYGEPGTGKTLAAHAVASKINRNILVASYAQIESMYHGEGPKNVEALFLAAEREQAILFIDEADSLLSQRLTHVTQGSEQAINSMRSQLLICLEQFHGIVIFATNLIENYDKAFETRVRNVYFPLPDKLLRQKIWEQHLPQKLPLSQDVCVEQLAEIEDICGRDIKNAVVDAAMKAAHKGKEMIEFIDIIEAINYIKVSKANSVMNIQDLSQEEQNKIALSITEKTQKEYGEK